MVKHREGFHDLFAQIPLPAWERLSADADAKGVSVAQLLSRHLYKIYRISEEEYPKPKRSGRKPKKDDGEK